jgi:hypothetical protein
LIIGLFTSPAFLETITAQVIGVSSADTLVFEPHSPRKAAIYSAAFPGLGQAYNKKYWKMPFVYAGLGTFAYLFVHYNREYQAYRKGYIDYNDKDSLSNSWQHLEKIRPNFDINRQLVFYKDTYRRYRDLNVILFAGMYMLNVIDATVDAHFFDFDISDDLTLRVEPYFPETAYIYGTFGLKCSIKF